MGNQSNNGCCKVRLVALVMLMTPLAAHAAIDCGSVHFVSNGHVLPTHDEALDACRLTQDAMTDTRRGSYDLARACHDVAAPGSHGTWRHGIVAMDVRERDTGTVHAVEGVWMCKPRGVETAP